MLIKNSSKILSSVHLHLEYDDKTQKDKIVAIGDKLYLSFRRNHKVEVEYGIITDISSRTAYKLASVCGIDDGMTTTDAYIEFDMSKPYDSKIVKIPLSDIIDFEFIPKEEYGGINPDHKIPLKIYEGLHKE